MPLLDLIFPKTCLGCGKEGVYICSDCMDKMKLSGSICPYCEKASIDGITHTKCIRKFGLDGLASVWEYEGVVRKALIALKYKYATGVGREIMYYLLPTLTKKFIPAASCLVPIPMFWYRQNTRGFNQSAEVGKIISTYLKLGFEPDLLIRKKPTIPQVELAGFARRRNLRGVFTVNSGLKLPDFVLLFDDVFTTGSTLMEATKVLKRAGVQKVWGLTIAR